MGIFDCLKKKNNNDFGSKLAAIFDILCQGDAAVMHEISDCLSNTKSYFDAHQAQFDDRDMIYSFDGERWIQFIAATNAIELAGYAVELDYKDNADEFRAALTEILTANHIQFSLKNLTFNSEKSIPDWVTQFNEYAGQSGITVYSIDIDSDSYVLGAAKIADYAKASDIGGTVGINISCRPR